MSDLDDVITWLTELGARTVIFDVEPLIAPWNTGEEALRDGVEAALAQVLVIKEINGAWRLGFNFAHVQQQISQLQPWGPRLMHHLGRPLAPRLFHQHPDKS